MDAVLNIALCDDLPGDREQVVSLIEQCDEFDTHCDVFASGEELLDAWKPDKYDLIILDIYMEDLTGIDTLSRIRASGDTVPAAIVTSTTDFTLESYRLHVIKYIEKPVTAEAILDLLRLVSLSIQAAPALHFKIRGEQHSVPAARIMYAEQQGHNVVLHLRDGSSETFRSRLDDVEEELKALGNVHFMRCHKSYLVNLAGVSRLDPELRSFIMPDGTAVPVRRESMSDAKKALKEFLFARPQTGGGKSN